MLLEAVLVSTMTFGVTSYRSVPEQTDDSPFITSIGLHVREGFCAISQDQLGKEIHYGDVLYVEVPAKPSLSRFCVVADCMNKRIKRGVDFWVATKAQEKAVGVRRGYVYLLNNNYTTTTSLKKSIELQCTGNKCLTTTPRLKHSITKLLNNDKVNDRVKEINTKSLEVVVRELLEALTLEKSL